MNREADLVILGKQSVDDDQNQTGQVLAESSRGRKPPLASKKENLESEAEKKKLPGIVVDADGKRIRVAREVDGGVETLNRPAAVVTADLRLNVPRVASLPGIMKAKKKPVKEIEAASLKHEPQAHGGGEEAPRCREAQGRGDGCRCERAMGEGARRGQDPLVPF